jgi:hypothetical protein
MLLQPSCHCNVARLVGEVGRGVGRPEMEFSATSTVGRNVAFVRVVTGEYTGFQAVFSVGAICGSRTQLIPSVIDKKSRSFFKDHIKSLINDIIGTIGIITSWIIHNNGDVHSNLGLDHQTVYNVR